MASSSSSSSSASASASAFDPESVIASFVLPPLRTPVDPTDQALIHHLCAKYNMRDVIRVAMHDKDIIAVPLAERIVKFDSIKAWAKLPGVEQRRKLCDLEEKLQVDAFLFFYFSAIQFII